MNITAAGYVEGNIVAKETSYSKVVTNDSMIGIAPELKYEKSDSIDSVTLRFEVCDEYIKNIEEVSGEWTSSMVYIK